MSNIKQNGKTYQVNEEIQIKFPKLIKMVLLTESMNDNEKQYWFDIIPSMTNKQIYRLFNILNTERKKLKELEIIEYLVEKKESLFKDIQKLKWDKKLNTNDFDG